MFTPLMKRPPWKQCSNTSGLSQRRRTGLCCRTGCLVVWLQCLSTCLCDCDSDRAASTSLSVVRKVKVKSKRATDGGASDDDADGDADGNTPTATQSAHKTPHETWWTWLQMIPGVSAARCVDRQFPVACSGILSMTDALLCAIECHFHRATCLTRKFPTCASLMAVIRDASKTHADKVNIVDVSDCSLRS